LFNRLVERERAIVTATPGTTRDLVSETVAIGGIPVRLVDTAGIRTALDEAESIGVRKSMEAMADADVVLIVLDVANPAEFRTTPLGESSPDGDLVAKSKGRARLLVLNKIDLAPEARYHAGKAPVSPHLPELLQAPDCVVTSALTGEGIEELRSKILRLLGGDAGAQQESGFLTNVRQQKLVEDAIAALDQAAGAVPVKTPHEMVLLDLYGALRPLDDITGATTADDILNLIFSSFCIGK
jgi:tRNA modification GTPase